MDSLNILLMIKKNVKLKILANKKKNTSKLHPIYKHLSNFLSQSKAVS